jgi:hypothetical protein
MSTKDNIWFFISTVFSVLFSIYQYGMTKENSDSNAASMYLVVFGFLAFLFWIVNFFFMSVCRSFFNRKKLTWLSLLIPTFLYLISLIFIAPMYRGMMILLICVTGIINLFFYFKTSAVSP